MDNTKLHATHKRLTILFTGMVFLVVFAFGVSAIFAKYYTEQNAQKKEFELATESLLQKFSRGEEMFPNIWEQGRQRLQDVVKRFTEANVVESFISFFVLDSENRIVLDNIVEKPYFDQIILDRGDIFYIDDETMVRVADIKNSILWEKIIFYKNQRYSQNDFMYDLTAFLFLSLFLTIALYFIWYKFVGKALRPVQRSLEDMSDFVHNAGHELKTPLAVMRGNLQVMQSEKEYDPKLIKTSIKEVDHINNLIEGLRELAELGQLSEKENLALAPEVTKVLREYEVPIEEKKLQVHNSVKGMFVVFANRNELHVLLANLISNAVKYTQEEWTIDISLRKNILLIRDSWQGISAEEQEKIFHRFYQGEKVRSKEGFGIGLSLVKKIADTNGWKVEVESKPGAWSTFKVSF